MKTDLLKFVDSGGCSSKISPAKLEEILKYLPLPDDPDILVNIETHDDAGVFRVNDELALVLTTDFFPPLCSDPYEFGQIAAANSISDIYAMGGDPVLALNIMMFPSDKLPMEAYADILRGGYDKASEAGVKIIGGHTIDDPVPKYGLAVVGYIHPSKIVTNSGAKPGDAVIITKPLGTGIVLAGLKLGIASPSEAARVLESMKFLNSKAAEVMRKYNVRGATDITGYGLAGHLLKMAKGSNVTISVDLSKVPLFPGVRRLAEAGCIPGASFRNLDYAENDVSFGNELDYDIKMIAFDAQTSGGMVICVPDENAEKLLGDLLASGRTDSAMIGRVLEKDGKYLIING